MASLYRPVIITYRLADGSYRTPDGKRVTKNTPGAVRAKTRSKKWYGRFTDGAGKPQRPPLSESKETARRMLAKLAGDAQLTGVGIIDKYAKHFARPLTTHVEDYRRFLEGKGDTAQHIAKTSARLRAILDACDFKTLDDLQTSPVVDFLAQLRASGSQQLELPAGKEEYRRTELAAILGINRASVARALRRLGLTGKGQGRARRYDRQTVATLQEELRQGLGIATCNHYLAAVKGFTRWLARDRRMPADPLSHLARQNPDVDVRRQRRALNEDLFTKFVESTATGKPYRGISGPERLVLYTLAAHTGFRANELATLTPESFDLASDAPTVTVKAAYSKRRRKDVQPIREDVRDLLRSFLAGRAPRSPVWPGTWKDTAAEMLRGDLEPAGIPYRDEDGRYFDFHAMRGQFISLLAAKGVHPKVAQALARHSTITLTMDYYTHLDVLDVSGALDKLPKISGTAKDESKSRKDRRHA